MPRVTRPFTAQSGPLLHVGVRRRGSPPETPHAMFSALLDTGADVTAIHPKAAVEIGLVPHDALVPTGSAGGDYDAEAFTANLCLVFGDDATDSPTVVIPSWELRGLHPDAQVRFVIGRDILCRGIFAIDGHMFTLILDYPLPDLPAAGQPALR